jgi:hypothetical protein
MRYFHSSAALLVLMTFAGGCNETSGADESEPIQNFHICIGDLRLVIPRDEAGMFRVNGLSLLSERSAYVTVDSFGPLLTNDFYIVGPEGSRLRGTYFLSTREMHDPNSTPKAAPLPQEGRETMGELLGKQVSFVVSDQPIPGSTNKGQLMTMRQRVADKVSILMHLKSNEISKEQVPDFLSGLEYSLVRWSSGQVLREPDGDPQCPASPS